MLGWIEVELGFWQKNADVTKSLLLKWLLARQVFSRALWVRNCYHKHDHRTCKSSEFFCVHQILHSQETLPYNWWIKGNFPGSVIAAINCLLFAVSARRKTHFPTDGWVERHSDEGTSLTERETTPSNEHIPNKWANMVRQGASLLTIFSR